MIWVVVGAVAGAISGGVVLLQNLYTIRKLQLEIRKLRREEEQAGGRIRAPSPDEVEKYGKRLQRLNVAGNAGLILLMIVIVFASQSGLQQIARLATENEEAKGKAEGLRLRNDGLTEQIKTQRQQLERSLETFLRHYATRVSEADDAIETYRAFDTPSNQKEYGDNFPNELNRRKMEARVQMQALVDHVEKWEPVLNEFAKFFNGRFHALKDALTGNDDPAAFQSFARLRENLDSDSDRLKVALDKATQQPTKGPNETVIPSGG